MSIPDTSSILAQMQALLRNEGPAHMDPADMVKFVDAHEKGALLPPDV
jgi:hypothetical protein